MAWIRAKLGTHAIQMITTDRKGPPRLGDTIFFRRGELFKQETGIVDNITHIGPDPDNLVPVYFVNLM